MLVDMLSRYCTVAFTQSQDCAGAVYAILRLCRSHLLNVEIGTISRLVRILRVPRMCNIISILFEFLDCMEGIHTVFVLADTIFSLTYIYHKDCSRDYTPKIKVFHFSKKKTNRTTGFVKHKINFVWPYWNWLVSRPHIVHIQFHS